MTLVEATAEAKERWGPRAGARIVREPGKKNQYAVGVLALDGRPVTFAVGDTLEEAFATADKSGFTPKKVRKVLQKAEAMTRREAFWAAFATLFSKSEV